MLQLAWTPAYAGVTEYKRGRNRNTEADLVSHLRGNDVGVSTTVPTISRVTPAQAGVQIGGCAGGRCESHLDRRGIVRPAEALIRNRGMPPHTPVVI